MTPPLRGLACLVLAHAQPQELGLLLHALHGAGARCFLHLDRRAEGLRHDLAEHAPPGITVLPRALSHRIAWGSFAMVRAVLDLMREALRDPATAHLCLLSGTHLPVRPAEEIAAYLFDDQRQHMDLRLAAAQPTDRESLQRFLHRGMAGREAGNRLLRWVNRHAWLLGPRDVAGGLRGITPMSGSQWWHMTAPCARHLLAFLDASPWFLRFFEGVRIPDEAFFQTLVHASPFRDTVGPPMSWQRIDNFSPTTMDAALLAEAQRSGLPFARKFDMARHADAARIALEAAGFATLA